MNEIKEQDLLDAIKILEKEDPLEEMDFYIPCEKHAMFPEMQLTDDLVRPKKCNACRLYERN